MNIKRPQRPREKLPRGWKNLKMRRLKRSNTWCIEADVEDLLLGITKRHAFILDKNDKWQAVRIEQDARGRASCAVLGEVPAAQAHFLSDILPQEARPKKERLGRVPLAVRARLWARA